MIVNEIPSSQQFSNIPWPETVVWKDNPPFPLPIEIRRGFWALHKDASRYHFSNNLSPDWKTWRSHYDFWGFGIWTNERTFEIITFAEGDITYERYISPEDFGLRLQSLPKNDDH